MKVTMIDDQDLKEVFGPRAIVILKKNTNPIVSNRLGEWLLAKGVAKPYEAPPEIKKSSLLDDKGQPIVYQTNEKKQSKK